MYFIATNRKHSELSIQDSDYEENIVAKVSFEAFVPRTPTKQDLSKPVVLYSTRYRDLFSRFCDTQLGVNGGASVGKMKQLPSLRELLSRCSAHLRNGVFQLDYVTPLQLEAVRNFIWGDNDEVDLRVRIKPKPILIWFQRRLSSRNTLLHYSREYSISKQIIFAK